jgi:alkylation response protein AidB-like acyl-CoA dehydrogenase
VELTFSKEQTEWGATLRDFLGGTQSVETVLHDVESEPGWNRAVWRRLATEIGVHGLLVPETCGGAGFGIVELGVVFEELGRALVPGPYLATLGLAVPALLAADDEEARQVYLPGIVDGTTVATLAVTEGADAEDAGDIAPASTPRVTTTARRTDGGWRLTGAKEYVLGGTDADLLLVTARIVTGLGPGGLSLFAVDGDTAGDGLTRTELATLDPTRRQARVELRDAPARLVGAEGSAGPVIAEALRTGCVLLAAEQVGSMAAALDLTVAYAGVRTQFDRPIGSFQVIKHKAADMLLRLEAARSAELYALWATEAVAADRIRAVRIAKICCSEGSVFTAGQCMQVHGGIGFTWEHPAHLFLKRAKSSEVLLGSPAFHRERLVRELRD